MADSIDVTDLVRRAQDGDNEAVEALLSVTYDDLRRLARARLRGGGRDLMLDTTSLVNEWFVRFAQAEGVNIQDRVHFMRYAARVMRTIIVDFARRQNALKHGGNAVHVPLTLQIADGSVAGAEEIVRVHEVLDRLATLDARMARVVEMRYFGGMTEAEIAQAIEVSTRTVRRDWERARLWLADALAR